MMMIYAVKLTVNFCADLGMFPEIKKPIPYFKIPRRSAAETAFVREETSSLNKIEEM